MPISLVRGHLMSQGWSCWAHFPPTNETGSLVCKDYVVFLNTLFFNYFNFVLVEARGLNAYEDRQPAQSRWSGTLEKPWHVTLLCAPKHSAFPMPMRRGVHVRGYSGTGFVPAFCTSFFFFFFKESFWSLLILRWISLTSEIILDMSLYWGFNYQKADWNYSKFLWSCPLKISGFQSL